MSRFHQLILTGAILVALALLTLTFSSKVFADDESVWLTSGFSSYHTNEDAHGYNQNNTGFGVEYHRTHALSYIAGEYDNSIFRIARYAGVSYEPWNVLGIKFGATAGLVSGYSDRFKIVPVAAPSASVEFRYLGINVIWVPSVVVALQLKLRIW